MIITTVFNRKGGVGKSLLTQSIANFIASTEKDKKVLLIDLDSQANLTSRIYNEEHSNYTIGDAMVDKKIKLKDLIIENVLEDYPNLHLIPANENLKYLEEVLSGMSNDETAILDWLSDEDNIDTAKSYDYIFWDLSPSLSIVNRNALLTCSNIIFVNQFGTAESITSIDKFIGEYKEHCEDNDFDMCDFVVFTNMHNGSRPDKTTKKAEEIEGRFEYLKEFTLNTKISYSSVIRNSCTEKVSVDDYVKTNLGSRNALKQMNNLIKELKEREIL